MKTLPYVTESSFAEILLALFPAEEITQQYRLPKVTGSRQHLYRFDYHWVHDGVKHFLEFDGYQHYTQSATVIRDGIKKRLVEELGGKLIRWPYWIQPSRLALSHYITYTDKDFSRAYRHGFVDKKAVTPADFCGLGWQRFETELTALVWEAPSLARAVIGQIQSRIAEESRELIVPPFTVDKLDGMNAQALSRLP